MSAVRRRAASSTDVDPSHLHAPLPAFKVHAPEAPHARHLRTLPEQIAERLYAAIVDGSYQPGDRVPEEALAESFGVSRGPVRDALRLLEKDGVLNVSPNRGAQVTRLSASDLEEIFEIRMVLAGAMVRRIVKAHRELAQALESRVQELERLVDRADQGSAYVSTSVELTIFMADSCGNKRLAEIMRSLARQSWRYTRLVLTEPARRRESAAGWRELLDAMGKGRADAAGRAMEKLVDGLRQDALRCLEARPVE